MWDRDSDSGPPGPNSARALLGPRGSATMKTWLSQKFGDGGWQGF